MRKAWRRKISPGLALPAGPWLKSPCAAGAAPCPAVPPSSSPRAPAPPASCCGTLQGGRGGRCVRPPGEKHAAPFMLAIYAGQQHARASGSHCQRASSHLGCYHHRWWDSCRLSLGLSNHRPSGARRQEGERAPCNPSGRQQKPTPSPPPWISRILVASWLKQNRSTPCSEARGKCWRAAQQALPARRETSRHARAPPPCLSP